MSLSSPRPPLEVGEGIVEVGWGETEALGPSEFVAEATIEPPAREKFVAPLTEVAEAVDNEERPPAFSPAPPREEWVADHYAAIQAWNEWAENQGRILPTPEDSTGAVENAPPTAAEVSPSALGDEIPVSPNVWADSQQTFAPYSQLFSRLRPSRDAR
jgi:hypothetical protein